MGDRADGGWSQLSVSVTCSHRRQRPLPEGTPSRPSLAPLEQGGGGSHSRAVTGAGAGCHLHSPLDGISQEPHNVVAFCSRGLEALGPVEKDALWGEGEGLSEFGDVCG